MDTNEKSARYELKLGTINEVLGGRGSEVDSYEDLYCSGKTDDLIFVPKVIGVYQREADYDRVAEEDASRISSLVDKVTQVMTLKEIGEEDRIDSDLICMVYDPQVFKKDIIESALVDDTWRRIKTTGYDAVPDFQTKTYIDEERLKWVVSQLEHRKKAEENKSKAQRLLVKEIETLGLHKENYGLTRKEALGYLLFRQLLSHLRGEPELITDPAMIKIGGAIIKKLDELDERNR